MKLNTDSFNSVTLYFKLCVIFDYCTRNLHKCMTCQDLSSCRMQIHQCCNTQFPFLPFFLYFPFYSKYFKITFYVLEYFSSLPLLSIQKPITRRVRTRNLESPCKKLFKITRVNLYSISWPRVNFRSIEAHVYQNARWRGTSPDDVYNTARLRHVLIVAVEPFHRSISTDAWSHLWNWWNSTNGMRNFNTLTRGFSACGGPAGSVGRL